MLLTDLVMPGVDGRQLIARCAALRPALPVLCMTGFAGDDHHQAGYGPNLAGVLVEAVLCRRPGRCSRRRRWQVGPAVIARLGRLPVLDRVAAAYAAVYLCCLAAKAAGIDVPVVLDVAFYPLGLAVGWASWRNGNVTWLDARTRIAWRLIASGAMVLWVSGSVWTFWITYLGPSSYALWIDRVAFVQYLLAVAGYLCFPSRPLPPKGRWRFVLDAALVVVAGFVIAFYIGLRMLLHDQAEPMTVVVVEASLDWLLFVVAAVGASQKRDRVARRALTLMLCANLLAMAGNTVLALLPAYTNGHPVDGLWFGAWVIRWIAARHAWHHYQRGADAQQAAPPEPEYRSNPFAFVLVGGASVLLVGQIIAEDRAFLGQLAIAAMGMGGLLVLRQLAELEENRRLLKTQVERDSRFTSLVSHSSDVVVLIDASGRLSYVSPSVVRVFGADARVERGMHVADLLAADDAKAVASILARGPSGAPRLETRVQVAPGRWREIEATWRDLRGDPAVRSIVVNCRDVTDRNEIERHLRHAQKLDVMGHMAGGLAHDLNNVLAVIRGYSELLQSQIGESSPAAADLAEIIKAVDRATAVTRKVLAFSRKQQGRRVVLDLNGVVNDVRPMLGHLVKDQVEVRVRLADGLWPIYADPGQMEQVLVNLATNARDAMPDGGVIDISTSNRLLPAVPWDPRSLPAGDYVCVAVRDEGTGMPPAVLSRVFEPFFTTKPKDRGVGLGLAIVHGIVTDMEGRIAVDSVEGRGSTFTILLPRVAVSVAASGPAA